MHIPQILLQPNITVVMEEVFVESLLVRVIGSSRSRYSAKDMLSMALKCSLKTIPFNLVEDYQDFVGSLILVLMKESSESRSSLEVSLTLWVSLPLPTIDSSPISSSYSFTILL